MAASDESTGIWMPLYIGDYLSRTSRLTTQQHGAYLLLMMDYWKNGPLPDDDAILAQITRLPADAWSMHRAALQGFFSIEGNHWIHTDLDAALLEAQEKRRKATERAKAGARAMHEKRKQRHSSGNAQAQLKQSPSNAHAQHEQCPSPSPSPSEEKHIPPSAGESSPAMGTGPSIWDLWVQVTGDQKSRSFLGKQIKDHGEPAVRRAVLETINKQPADPNSYLLGVLRDRKTTSGLSVAERIELANADPLISDADQIAICGEASHVRS